MPLYEYKCPKCAYVKELSCRINDKPSHLHCVNCGEILKEQFSCNSITYFKGHSKTPVPADMNADYEAKVSAQKSEDENKARSSSRKKFVQGVNVPKRRANKKR